MDGREPGMSGINEDVSREVEQFLYREARLLDERHFHEWFELLTDDVRYWMGSRSNRYPKSSKAIAILDPDRYVEDDLTKEDELAILDETKQTLWRSRPRAPSAAARLRRPSRLFGLPLVERRAADAVIAVHLSRLRSCLLLAQDRNDR